MERNFKALALSYKNTPLEIREEISLDMDESKRLITLLKETSSATNILVLSTCNRTEIYYYSDEVLLELILKCIGLVKTNNKFIDFKSHFESIENHQEAVNRLFRVAMGLEAQVVGDMEISNQVKVAYQLSADEDVAGPFLHRLMHTIFHTNKRVVQETPFRDGAASVSYASTELVTELAQNYISPKILVIGLGEIGTALCKNLADSELTDISISNRTYSKIVDLASETGFKVIPFEEVYQAMDDADIIISSVARKDPFITLDIVRDLTILSHKFFIDLSVPRSIDPAIEQVPGALVYNVDTIQNKATQALQKRIDAIPLVESIVNESINDLSKWTQEMELSPTINKLKNALEDIRKDEIAKFVKKASESELEFLNKASKSMMQKVMKLPVLQLKAACKRGEADTLIDILNDLFDLEKQPTDNH